MSAPRDFAKIFAIALAGSGFLLTAQSALAQDRPVVVYADPPADVRSELVSFADLDLATAKGAKRLHYRVGKAVKNVCLFDTNRGKLQPIDYHACATGAWDDARPQLALAIDRARQLALGGQPATMATAITVSAGR